MHRVRMAMTIIRRVCNWLKYESLHHYPELTSFEPSAALKRLRAYEQEERLACRPWLWIIWTLIGLFVLLLLAYAYSGSGMSPRLASVPILVSFVFRYLLYRRIRRRVRHRVASELCDGRLWTCIECGYDLRASKDRCPECGAAIQPPPLRANM